MTFPGPDAFSVFNQPFVFPQVYTCNIVDITGSALQFADLYGLPCNLLVAGKLGYTTTEGNFRIY